MKFSRAILFGMCLAVAPVAVMAQTNKSEFELMQSIVANPDNTPRPVFPVPSRRQLLWNETEFYAFFHYGMDHILARSGATAPRTNRHLPQHVCPTQPNGCVWPSKLE